MTPLPPAGPLARVHPTLPVTLLPNRLDASDRRVIPRRFQTDPARSRRLLTDLDRVPETDVVRVLAATRADYDHRHFSLHDTWRSHLDLVANDDETIDRLIRGWSPARQQLGGAYLTMEYAVESAALFNPSAVLHPDQSGAAPGCTRFVLSLRATGEGHVSSIVFRTGEADAEGGVTLDPGPQRLRPARMAPDRFYDKQMFGRKLYEMDLDPRACAQILRPLPDQFTLDQITQAAAGHTPPGDDPTLGNTLRWLAESNYHVTLDEDATLDELVIFPLAPAESNGLEDLRLTRFVEEDGDVRYYGTYTAYNGHRTLPMLLETRDFRRLDFHSLNGPAALNKGMALFPRRIGGDYVMCGRIDGERLFIMRSDSVHFWDHAEPLIGPRHPWELMQIGNCGAPVETDAGWLVLTHGVGPMRTYAIGALVLDLDDPLKVIGHLRQPLLAPSPAGREGYVPNVLYSCGGFVHHQNLLLPFALADSTTAAACVPIDALVEQAIADHGDDR